MSSNFPLVSVIVPCFNSGETLMRTISSIERQTYGCFEIIIVDDGSNDLLTISRLDEMRSKYSKILKHEKNLGLPAARNSGFKYATGDFILFLDSDDWLEDSAIEKMLSSYWRAKRKVFVFSDLIFEGDRSGVSERIYKPFSQLVINRIPYCFLISKNDLQFDDLYNEDLRDGLEDWDFNLRLLESGFTPLRIAEPLFHYSIGLGGLFTRKTRFRFFSIWKQIRRSHKNTYKVSNLLKLVNEEIKNFGFPSICLPFFVLFLSSLRIDFILNRFFVFGLLFYRKVH
jgi:glycosyltransferase involved in cell wall biosynthesis